jgi:hypothetical protein
VWLSKNNIRFLVLPWYLAEFQCGKPKCKTIVSELAERVSVYHWRTKLLSPSLQSLEILQMGNKANCFLLLELYYSPTERFSVGSGYPKTKLSAQRRFAPERQWAGNKEQTEAIEDGVCVCVCVGGGGINERGKGYFSYKRGGRAKDCLQTKRRQKQHIGKCWFIKIKGETQCLLSNFNWAFN